MNTDLSAILPPQPAYEVVSPTGERATTDFDSASSVVGLAGRTIGLFWIQYVHGDILQEAFAGLLSERFPGVNIAKLPAARNGEWGGYPDASIAELAREAGVDAAVVTIGC